MGKRFNVDRPAKVDAVRKGYEAGLPILEIMRSAGVSRSFVFVVKKELGLSGRWSPAYDDARPGEKRCPKCEAWKPVAAFGPDNNRAGALRCWCYACERDHFFASRRDDRAMWLYHSTLKSARKRSLSHTITPSHIVVPDHCPVLGIPLFFTHGKRTPNSPSVDRLNNDRGYEPGNIIVVSYRANFLRANATSEELRKLVAFYCLD